MTKQKNSTKDNVSVVPAKNKKLATHALYCDPSKVRIPAHSPFGRMIGKVISHLSGPFLDKPSPFAQTMIDGLAVNIIIAKFFQASFLRGDKMAPSVLRDYTTLWNGVSRDLATLSGMAKESGVKDPVPSLEAYLAALKKTDEIDPPEPVKAKVTPKPANAESVKRTLF